MRQYLFTLVMAAGLAIAAGAPQAMAAPAPCSPFAAFPLSINLGTGLNTGDGETTRCSLGKVMDALNALQNTSATPNFVSMRMNGAQTLKVDPLANPANINFSTTYVDTITQHDDNMEMMNVWNCTANRGFKHTVPPDSYFNAKVCGYFGLHQIPGAGDSFTLNPIMLTDANVGNHSSIGVEIDHYNNNIDYNPINPGGDSGEPVGSALYISGAGSKKLGSAILINMAQEGFKLQRGFAIYNGSVAGNTYEDRTNSGGSGIYMSGTKAYGIDMSAMTAQIAAIHLGSSHGIAWRNNANTADIAGLTKDTADQVHLPLPTMIGYVTSGGDPGAVNIPAGQCVDWLNTTSNILRHVCNVAGTLRSVALN